MPSTQKIKGSQIQPTAVTKDLLNPNVAGNGISLGADGSIQVNALRSAGFIMSGGYLTVDTMTEILNGTPDGVKIDFTLNYIPALGQENIYLNGLFQQSGVDQDYTISGKTVTFNMAPSIGAKIVAKYPIANRFPTLQSTLINGSAFGLIDAAGNAYWHPLAPYYTSYTPPTSSPTSVPGGHMFSDLMVTSGWYGYWNGASEEYVAYARDKVGMMWSWGWGSTPGGYRAEVPGLGNNTGGSITPTPVAIARSASYSQIGYACALDGATGMAYTWGAILTNPGDPNTEFFPGDNTVESRSSPVAIARSSSYTAVIRQTILGGYAIDADGSLWGWGINENNSDRGIILGDNTLTRRSSPVSIPVPAMVKSLSLYASAGTGGYGGGGYSQTAFVIDVTGMIWAWGENQYGYLGDNSTSSKSSPVSIARPGSYTQVVANNYLTAAIDGATGAVWVWGNGTYGGMGNGTTNSYSSPVSVLGGRSYIKIVGSKGYSFYAIEGATGMIYAWGYNANGQLGDNTTQTRSSPTAIARPGSYVDVICDGARAFAIDAVLGQVYAWGYNNSSAGDLVDGTLINRSSPVAIFSPPYFY